MTEYRQGKNAGLTVPALGMKVEWHDDDDNPLFVARIDDETQGLIDGAEIINPNFKDPGVPVFDLKVTWHEKDDTLYCVGNWHDEGLLQHLKSRKSNLDVLNGQLVHSINEWIKQKKSDLLREWENEYSTVSGRPHPKKSRAEIISNLIDGIGRDAGNLKKIADYFDEKKIEEEPG